MAQIHQTSIKLHILRGRLLLKLKTKGEKKLMNNLAISHQLSH